MGGRNSKLLSPPDLVCSQNIVRRRVDTCPRINSAYGAPRLKNVSANVSATPKMACDTENSLRNRPSLATLNPVPNERILAAHGQLCIFTSYRVRQPIKETSFRVFKGQTDCLRYVFQSPI